MNSFSDSRLEPWGAVLDMLRLLSDPRLLMPIYANLLLKARLFLLQLACLTICLRRALLHLSRRTRRDILYCHAHNVRSGVIHAFYRFP
jgi:hypothetical protein